MSDTTILMLIGKITKLATDRGLPLNILENPKYTEAVAKDDGSKWEIDFLLATIGNITVSFDGYSLAELMDLYAELKSGLDSEEARKMGHAVGWDAARQAYAKSP